MPQALALVASLAIFATGGGVIDWLVNWNLFHPTPGVSLDPERAGIPAEEVYLETEDGVRIHAFHLPSPGARRAILFLHGNAGNASHRLPNAELLRRLGADVLLLDYRGYGRSEGSPDERGVYADARAALAHLSGPLGHAEERIVVFGRSLGGAVAVDLAQRRQLAGVILESTFPSLRDAGAVHFGRFFAPLVDGRFTSDQKIQHVSAPLLFFHGDRDRIVPHALGEKLFTAAAAPKAFETLRGAGHNDTVQVGGARYVESIRAFLDRVAP